MDIVGSHPKIESSFYPQQSEQSFTPSVQPDIDMIIQESGIYRGPMKHASYKKEERRTQSDPISLQRTTSCEMPFSDEEEDGPSSFTYYTVPAAIVDATEGKTRPMGVGQMMPELKKLAVKGELSDREKQVFRYFRRRKIMEFLQFMMNHLLAVEPGDSHIHSITDTSHNAFIKSPVLDPTRRVDNLAYSEDPMDFLRGLLDQCLLFRSGHLQEPPVLFGQEHLESLFTSFDPLKKGSITIQQYHTAMLTLMVRGYNSHPERDENDGVSRQVFLSNAKSTLIENLLDLTLLTSSVTQKPPEVVAIDTTPTEKQQKITVKNEMKNYMKTLLKGMKAEEEAQESPEEIVELDEVKGNNLLPKQEKFGEFARPLKRLQEAFEPAPELQFE